MNDLHVLRTVSAIYLSTEASVCIWTALCHTRVKSWASKRECKR